MRQAESTEIYGRHSVTAALSSSCMLLSQRLSSYKWGREREGEMHKGRDLSSTLHRLHSSNLKYSSLPTITLSFSEPGVTCPLCDNVSVIWMNVPELYILGCGVFYLQHLWPWSVWTSFYNQYQSLWESCPASPPPPPPPAPGFLSVVINGTRAPARLTLPVPAMFPWYLMNSDKLLFPRSVVPFPLHCPPPLPV